MLAGGSVLALAAMALGLLPRETRTLERLESGGQLVSAEEPLPELAHHGP